MMTNRDEKVLNEFIKGLAEATKCGTIQWVKGPLCGYIVDKDKNSQSLLEVTYLPHASCKDKLGSVRLKFGEDKYYVHSGKSVLVDKCLMDIDKIVKSGDNIPYVISNEMKIFFRKGE